MKPQQLNDAPVDLKRSQDAALELDAIRQRQNEQRKEALPELRVGVIQPTLYI